MEVRFTPGGVSFPEAPPRGEAVFKQPVSAETPEVFSPPLPVRTDTPPEPQAELNKETLKDVLERTAELVAILSPDRHLKYEVIDDADLVQIQVIDTADGNIVRKIPADEIVRLVSRIRETLSERLDVRV